MDLIADQVKEIAFKLPLPADNPLNSKLLRTGPCENCSPYSEEWRAWLTLMEQTSIYSYVKHLRKVFNSLDIPKAWRMAKEKIDLMMRGEQPKLELLLLGVLNNAQGNNFWQSLDKVVVDLCQSRNDALDLHVYEALLSLIEEVVVGPPRRFDYDTDWLPGLVDTSNMTSLDSKTYFGNFIRITSQRLKHILFDGGFFTGGIEAFRIAVHTLVPEDLDQLFGEPYVVDLTQPPQPRWTLPFFILINIGRGIYVTCLHKYE